MSEDPELLEMKIENQGAVAVNTAYIVHKAENVICAYVDLSTKYVSIGAETSGGDMGPGLMLECTKHSLHLHEGKARDELTYISFPEYEGWCVFASNTSKYTVAVCLTKTI